MIFFLTKGFKTRKFKNSLIELPILSAEFRNREKKFREGLTDEGKVQPLQ